MQNSSCFVNGSVTPLNKSCFTSNTGRSVLTDSKEYILSSTILLCVLIPLIVIGNAFVIMAFATTRRLRTVTNYFVVSLAVADILVGGLSLPIFTVALHKGRRWRRDHPTVNELWVAVDMITSTASIVNLMYISVDRYICIQYPFRYHNLLSKTKVTVMIFLGWLYGVLNYSVLRLTFKDQRPRLQVTLPTTIMAFLLPLIVILAMYSKVGKIALSHRIRINAIEDQSKNDRINTGSRRTLSSIAELKATRTLAVVVGAFVLCFVGYFVVLLYTTICLQWKSLDCKPFPQELITSFQWIKYSNSSLNPFIYAAMNGDMRRAMKRFVQGRLVSSESSFEMT